MVMIICHDLFTNKYEHNMINHGNDLSCESCFMIVFFGDHGLPEFLFHFPTTLLQRNELDMENAAFLDHFRKTRWKMYENLHIYVWLQGFSRPQTLAADLRQILAADDGEVIHQTIGHLPDFSTRTVLDLGRLPKNVAFNCEKMWLCGF